MAPLRWLLLLSFLLFGLRIFAATRLGFGDAEALYVVYGLHLRLVHLDHPGLIGLVALLLGVGAAPSALRLHFATALAATVVPWSGVLAARWLGAPPALAPLAGLALVAAPEITVGLFALTPDLLLAPLWLLALGAWGRGLSQSEESKAWRWLSLGSLLAGLGALAKVSGVLLLAAMGASLLDLQCRSPRKALCLWGTLGPGVLACLPVLVAEVDGGFEMLTHRLVSTQREAGFSLRNAGALLGGQIGYLSPLVAVAATLLAYWLVRQGRQFAGVFRWLFLAFVVSGLPLGVLCLWSRVAEPHWLAPAWLPLSLLFSLPKVQGVVGARLSRWALGSGVVLSLLVHGWTLTDLAPRWLGNLYEGRYDLANDLLLWEGLSPKLASLRAQVAAEQRAEPVAVAPHWIVAAQARATGAVARASTVACLGFPGSIPDDFCRWEPPSQWGAPLLWVSDDRFPLSPPSLGSRLRVHQEEFELRRGGRVVRRARLEVWR
ncbi:MAG: hypothetical protein RMJ98_10945 [Myxococcales bacterium]|nr:hypothetical protein [Polyangiaceae bacterium]MDW8249803.1 hypothetical protein [Myxococcales bacterium]